MKFRNYYYLNSKEHFSQFDNDLNIVTNKKIYFGKGTDSDPYYIEKKGDNSDIHHLRITINDNSNESLQIWGNSCATPDGCGSEGTLQHKFDASGNVEHKGTVTASKYLNLNGEELIGPKGDKGDKGDPGGSNPESCVIRYGGCDTGPHWGVGNDHGNQYFDRLGGGVNQIAECQSNEYLKGFGIIRCNSGRGLQLKLKCCAR